MEEMEFLEKYDLIRKTKEDTIRALKNAKIDWKCNETGIDLYYIDSLIEKLKGELDNESEDKEQQN